jgi:CRISPR system Cascade subunit CasB
MTDYPFPSGKVDHASYALLRGWWENLESDRGGRAALRRAGTLTEVMLSPAFHRLLHVLRRGSYQIAEQRYPKLAAIAGLAARLRITEGSGLGVQCGSPRNSAAKKPAVSELRMRRLLACDDIEELYTLLRRVLALLDNQANLSDLAALIWSWRKLDDKHPFDPRRRLALDYYDAAPLNA